MDISSYTELADFLRKYGGGLVTGAEAADAITALAARIAELESDKAQKQHDYEINREISMGQARRIRELLSRLGEPCAPDIGLPPDEVGPLRAERDAALRVMQEMRDASAVIRERDAALALLRDARKWTLDQENINARIDALLAGGGK